MIAPFQNRYRMAWPFAVDGILEEIDTAAEFPRWSVTGDWRVPPGKVCDLLTAKDFTFSFEVNAEALNSQFGLFLEENILYLAVINSGTSLSVEIVETETSTIGNEENKWDTQIKLFERYKDPEEFPGISDNSLAALYYTQYITVEPLPGVFENYRLELTMNALIPKPAINQNGDYVWSSDVITQATMFFVQSGGDIEYPVTGDFNYLGLTDLRQLEDYDGAYFISSSILINSHFPA